MKKIIIAAVSFLLVTACEKQETMPLAKEQSAKNSKIKTLKVAVTRPISNELQSDPDPNPTSVYGGSIFYGNMTHLGKVHGKTVNTSFAPLSATDFSITSEDIVYASNGDELWTEGNIVVHFPTDGSTIATITGGSTIVGCTGRFTGASGFFIYENMVYDIVTGHESHNAHGEITY